VGECGDGNLRNISLVMKIRLEDVCRVGRFVLSFVAVEQRRVVSVCRQFYYVILAIFRDVPY